METFTTSISSKTLRPFDSHIDNMEVYGDDDATFVRKFNDDNSTRYRGAEDGEIGVFRAEKYFNGGMDSEEGNQKSTSTKKPSTTNTHHHMMMNNDLMIKPKPWVNNIGTPSSYSTVGSEKSSSINSQKPLLKMVSNNSTTTTKSIGNNNGDNNEYYCSHSMGKKMNNSSVQEISKSKGFFSTTFSYCKCYSCKDKASVDVNEDVGEISFSNTVTKPPNSITARLKLEEVSSESSFRDNNHFSFPTRSPKKVVHFQEEEVERKSLEVFGSPVIGRLRNKPISLEKRLAMLSWDLTNNNNNNIDDEINSDCSSDLFEIESLTKQTTTNQCQSPTASCYAPSEASVEWSVVTASALDFEERRPSTTTMFSPPPKHLHVNKLEVVVQKRRSSGLLGCNSQKAVRVAEDNGCKNMAPTSDSKSKSCNLLIERRKSESSVPMKIRVQDETKVGGFSFRSQGLPARTYSPRLSNISFNVQ